ncbi:MAG: EAL domain-containing protein [Bryobacteraceae bacterium]|nr:EAL domain-containing protein [Bryobacteraceae bacterium]
MVLRLRSSGDRLTTYLLGKLGPTPSEQARKAERRSRILRQLGTSDPNLSEPMPPAEPTTQPTQPAGAQLLCQPPQNGSGGLASNPDLDLRKAALERLAVMSSQYGALDPELSYRAHHDALTGLPNRHAFEERTNHGLAYARRYGRPMAILFIDLDGFKTVNDSLGHAAGDAVLREVAQRLRSALRESDIIARWGGDEFVAALLEVGSEHDAARAAQKLMDALKEPLSVEGQQICLSASIGISLYPEDGTDLSSLLRKADQEMYESRSRTRQALSKRPVVDPMQAGDPRLIESQLKFALQRGEFHLYYQPQFDLHTNRVYAIEALIRWDHPRLGMLQAGSFLPLAQRSRLMPDISAWTMAAASRQAARLKATGLGQIRVAVNISASQFAAGDFVTTLGRALDAAGAEPEFLELDLPEVVLAEDWQTALHKLNQLRGLGVHVSVDDFGSLFTSLDYVQRLPLSGLKLDQRLVRGTQDQQSLLIQSIIALAQTAGIRAIAEGIETAQQLQLVRNAGCDGAQGYLLGMPVPAEELHLASLLPAASLQ